MFSKPAESLHLQLLRWLLLPLLALLLVNAWFSNRAAAALADLAFDRLLVASAEAIGDDIEVQDGEVVVDLPYAALELLESNLQERIFYRVVSPDGKTVTGYDDLPSPQRTAVDAEPMLYAANYRGETVHLVALKKTLYGTRLAAPVMVLVAETGEARDALSRQILFDGLERQGLLIAAAAALVGLGLVRGLRPLHSLRAQIAQRGADDLSPIDSRAVQAEVRPLILALNQHTARIERLLESRQRLITDASHQMRTPLTEMRTQIEVSLRQPQPSLWRQTLLDVAGDIERLAHLLSQLLLQARCDPDGQRAPAHTPVDLGALVHQVTLDRVGAARKRTIDLGFEPPAMPATVVGEAMMLRELAANLVDNAIVHGRAGGHVVVRVIGGDRPVLEVDDDGAGIEAVERELVFERFYRSPAATLDQRPGSGLGLAIVRSIAAAHFAQVRLLDGPTGCGLRVRVEWPLVAVT